MITELQWDLEVDVVCLGAEGGVLASGLVAANAGFEVYLGTCASAQSSGDMATPLGYRGGDGPTTRHLAGFDYAFGDGGRARGLWPVRAVDDIVPPRPLRRATIEPFFGAELEQWALRCASAPNGLVYDRVTRRQMTEMRGGSRGEKVEAAVVGTVELSPGRPPLSLGSWLRDRASEADLLPDTDVRLVKLLFDGDAVAGALIETRDGPLAVRARENLILGVGDPTRARTHPLVSATEPVTVNICLVSKPASRFGELEILTATGDDSRVLFVDAPETELQLTG